jgi:hypothetical protein
MEQDAIANQLPEEHERGRPNGQEFMFNLRMEELPPHRAAGRRKALSPEERARAARMRKT